MVLQPKPFSSVDPDKYHHYQRLQENKLDVLRKNDDDLNFIRSLPPGYRFKPTDEELILHYLSKKVKNEPLPRNKINDVQLYDFNPEELSKTFKDYGEPDLYFFTPRNRKYKHGKRPNRSAGDGYWKATGADKLIMRGGDKGTGADKSENNTNKVIGYRKALVYYMGKPPKGQKTSWIMHEYRVHDSPEVDRSVNFMRLDDWVLCKIYKKMNKKKNNINEEHGEVEEEEVGNDAQEEVVDRDDHDQDVVKTLIKALRPHPQNMLPEFNNDEFQQFSESGIMLQDDKSMLHRYHDQWPPQDFHGQQSFENVSPSIYNSYSSPELVPNLFQFGQTSQLGQPHQLGTEMHYSDNSQRFIQNFDAHQQQQITINPNPNPSTELVKFEEDNFLEEVLVGHHDEYGFGEEDNLTIKT